MSEKCDCQNSRDVYCPQPAVLKRTRAVTETERYFQVQLESGQPLGHGPGQFVELSLPGIGEAPISISSSPDTTPEFDLVVRRVGRLTEALHALPENTRIGIRGPYGTTFPCDEAMKGKDILFVAGGIGMVPLRSAIQYVLNRKDQYGKIQILYGSRTPSERLFEDELAAWRDTEDVEFMETVDKADEHWQGNVGVITTLIPEAEIDPENTVAVICGPPVMYKFVLVELFSAGIDAENIYLSLERRMKCGVGKCGHCQINGLYTCLDGPVFQYSQITNLPEAI